MFFTCMLKEMIKPGSFRFGCECFGYKNISELGSWTVIIFSVNFTVSDLAGKKQHYLLQVFAKAGVCSGQQVCKKLS